MPTIRITGMLPKAALGMQTTNGDPDDDWIKKILQYESTKGSSSGGPLSNFGYNNWQKLGHNAAPTSIDEAVAYFKQDYLPKVQQYPMGMRERMADYMYNTGRSANDLLLYNAGKIDLNQLNSKQTFDKEWQQYGPDVQKMFSDPNFINKLDQSKDDVYKTTKQENGQPNSAYEATWKGRLGLFPKVSTTPSTGQQPTSSATQQPNVVQQQPSSATPGYKSETFSYSGYGDEAAARKAFDEEKKVMGQRSTELANKGMGTATPTINGPQQTGSTQPAILPAAPADISQINFKMPALVPPGDDIPEDEKLNLSPEEKAQYEKENKSGLFPIGSNVFETPKEDKETAAYNALSADKQQSFDKSLLGAQDTRSDRKQYENFYNKKNNITPPNWGERFANSLNKGAEKVEKFIQTPLKIANALNTGMVVGNAIGSYIDNERIGKDMQRKQLQSRFNAPVVNPQSTVGIRGDYTQEGIYDPRRYVVNKGMYTNELSPGPSISRYGGELTKKAYGGDIINDSIEAPLDLISLRSSGQQPNPQSAPLGVNTSESNSYSPNIDEEQDYTLPVSNFRITSGFGHRKAPQGPNGPASSEHNGLDLGVPINTDVFAPMEGIVKSIYSNGKGGNQLIIQHSDGSRTGYAHLNGYKVKVGDNVSRGQVVALSGNTGNSNGPHLHFTYRNPEGITVDPSSIFNFGGKKDKKNNSDQSNDPTFTNNPLNIHYSPFAKSYNATEGGEDAGGRIAIFPSIDVGIKATRDLFMGGGYNNLTISQARNKWVSGNPNITNPSTNDIVRQMGGDRKIKDLSTAELNKLILQFAKWENSKSTPILKKYGFEDGGEANNSYNYNEGQQYELTEKEIRDILANGGDVEFI